MLRHNHTEPATSHSHHNLHNAHHAHGPPMTRSRSSAKRVPVVAGLLLVALMIWAQNTGLAAIGALRERLEFLAYDLRLNAALPDRPASPTRTVIIDIDEASLQAEGQWPWSRTRIADLVDRLTDAGVVVIAFDILFAEPERNPVQQVVAGLERDDAALAQALAPYAERADADRRLAASLGSVDTLLGFVLHNEPVPASGTLPKPIAILPPDARTAIPRMRSATGNLPLLQDAALGGGFLTTLPDRDGAIRRSPLLLRHGDAVYPSLALAAASAYLLVDAPQIHLAPIGAIDAVDYVALGERRIPVDAAGQVLVPYRGPPATLPSLSATDVLQGRADPELLRNRIALVGASALALADLKATPVAGVFPGVEIQATLLTGLLEGAFLSEPAWAKGANFTLMLAIGCLLAFALPHLKAGLMLVAATLAIVLVTLGNLWLWKSGLVLALAMPLALVIALAVLNMVYGFLFETRSRQQLKSMFGQYVPPELVEEMSQQPEHFGFEGQSREMTVLFADIRGFTTLSESLPAHALKDLLHRFFTPMTRVIFDHRGTIDKYVGDMIMAFWGAPVRDARHAEHAIDAALGMLHALQDLRTALVREGLPEIVIGIGINSGVMNVGDMGSQYRRAYTVIGDAVNLASRLEGLTKYYGVNLVVGPRTRELAPDFVYRRLDRVRVKGKREAVEVFEPLCRRAELGDVLQQELDTHEQALRHFWARDWEPARTLFRTLHAAHPQTALYALYLERIERLRERTLPDDWDGVYERREK